MCTFDCKAVPSVIADHTLAPLGEHKECWTHIEFCAEICVQSPALVSRFFPHAFSRVTCAQCGGNHSVSFTPRYVHGSVAQFLRPILSAQIDSAFLDSDSDQEDPQ